MSLPQVLHCPLNLHPHLLNQVKVLPAAALVSRPHLRQNPAAPVLAYHRLLVLPYRRPAVQPELNNELC